MSFCIITQSKVNLAEVSEVVFSHKFLSCFSHKLYVVYVSHVVVVCVCVCVSGRYSIQVRKRRERKTTLVKLGDTILGEITRKMLWIKSTLW